MFQKLLEKLALSLEKRCIAYMIIGGQAVLVYGEPRLTKDIDIIIDLEPENVSDIIDVANDLGYEILVDSLETFVIKTSVLPCLEPETGIRIDFIFSFSSYEKQAFKRVKRIRMGKANVCFASVEDLVIHKIVAGRPRDIEDVTIILTKEQNIDSDYIHQWLEQFDRSLSQSFLTCFEELWKACR